MLAFVVIRTGATPTCSSGGSAAAVHPARRDPAPAAARRVHLRGRCIHPVGWLEPAATIGGDTFDYSLARDVLHLSITDAMGHGWPAR